MTLENVVDIIVEKFRPYSIFLYGSKATKSDNNWSDCEIGVIFEDGKYLSRKEIVDSINDTNYSIFPFKLSEISNHIIDTPFQKEIYLKSLIDGGAKTLYGVTVLENLEAPEVTREHLLADVNFNLGRALAALKIFKSGNYELANEFLYKSCLYATRDYIYYKRKKMYVTYEEMYSAATQLDELSDFKYLLDVSLELRHNHEMIIDEMFYYKNITYINKFILNNI